MAEKKSTVIHVLTIASLLLMLIVYILAWKHGLFTDQNALKSFLDKSGIWAGVIFIFLQILQVIFPIIPGGLGCLAGVLLFGAWHGFLYNYIGICLGSFFCLSDCPHVRSRSFKKNVQYPAVGKIRKMDERSAYLR